MKKTLIALCVVLVALAAYGAWSYERLASAASEVEERWKTVESEYAARLALAIALVREVEGGMDDVAALAALRSARDRFSAAQTTDEKAGAASEVESAYADLLFALEAYPRFASREEVAAARSAVEGTSASLLESLRNYNDSVRVYNMKATGFPSSLVAAVAGFGPKAYFQSADNLISND